MMGAIIFSSTFSMSGGALRPLTIKNRESEVAAEVVTEYQIIENLRQDFNSWSVKLEQLRGLADDWNGYGTLAPSEAAIVTAKAFLSKVLGSGSEPSRLAPSVTGGVGITHKKLRRRVYVEFFNDGDVCALFSDGETAPRSRRVKPGYGGFKELSQGIREYLDA